MYNLEDTVPTEEEEKEFEKWLNKLEEVEQMKTKKIIKVLKFLRKYCDSQYSCCDCEFIGMGCDRAFNGFNIERIEKELKEIETLK